MSDPFDHRRDDLGYPSKDAAEITPDDDAVFPVCQGVYVGTTGDLRVRRKSGVIVTYKAIPVGLYPFRCSQVFQTGTTASDIVVEY